MEKKKIWKTIWQTAKYLVVPMLVLAIFAVIFLIIDKASHGGILEELDRRFTYYNSYRISSGNIITDRAVNWTGLKHLVMNVTIVIVFVVTIIVLLVSDIKKRKAIKESAKCSAGYIDRFVLREEPLPADIPETYGGVFTKSSEIRNMEQTKEQELLVETARKDDLVTYLAHDLKTPMTTVSGYAQALSDGLVKDSEKQEYLDAIKTKTERMNEMINMLFDYTKLNSEGFTVSTEKLDLAEFLREIAASAYTDIEEAGDELDVDIPGETLEADIDRVQMTRVINNLLTNAVRHNAAGTRINVTLRQDGEDLIIFIADSGDMIPEKLAEGLFQPFVMGDESRQTKGGTGLGLSIAKKIVELHGATIKLSQKPEVARCHLGEEYNKAFVIHIQAA